MTHDILISVRLPICRIIEPTPFTHCVVGLSRETVIAHRMPALRGKITQEKKIERVANKRKT